MLGSYEPENIIVSLLSEKDTCKLLEVYAGLYEMGIRREGKEEECKLVEKWINKTNIGQVAASGKMENYELNSCYFKRDYHIIGSEPLELIKLQPSTTVMMMHIIQQIATCEQYINFDEMLNKAEHTILAGPGHDYGDNMFKHKKCL